MLLRISFSQQHQRKCRYIFAAPSDAITVVHRALRKFMRSMHRVRESELIGDWRRSSKGVAADDGCALSPRSGGAAVAADARVTVLLHCLALPSPPYLGERWSASA